MVRIGNIDMPGHWHVNITNANRNELQNLLFIYRDTCVSATIVQASSTLPRQCYKFV